MISYARLANGTKQLREEAEAAVLIPQTMQMLMRMLAGTVARRIAMSKFARSQRMRLVFNKPERNSLSGRTVTTTMERRTEEIPRRILALARRAMLSIRERFGNPMVLP